VEGTGSGSCPIVGLGINGVEILDPPTAELAN
jgi:hypothetical protein